MLSAQFVPPTKRQPAADVERLRWYLRRLRVMSAVELAHRVRELLLLQYLRVERLWRFRSPQHVWHHYAFCRAVHAQLPSLPFAEQDAEEVGRTLKAEFGALGFPWCWREEHSVWHRAPETGRAWPRRFFADVPFRSGNPWGDVRITWEPARLQGLVELALIAQRDPARAEAATALLERVLDSWVRANPYLTGVHYVSAMECALRLIAVCHALDMGRASLRNRESSWSCLVWLTSSHASLIARRLSRHSSAGNHTIAECTGLLYAAFVLAEEPTAARWRALALGTLTAEAARQILPDGGGIEQSPWYLLFVLDLLGMSAALLRHGGSDVPLELEQALRRGRDFLRHLGAGPGQLPKIGDSDDGFALSRQLRLGWAAGTDAAHNADSATFRDAGYTIRRGTGAHRWRLVFDHGPLGMAPSCGHGHADALAVTLDLGGKPVLLDPGTFAYNMGAEWRRYFRGTRAHNTVTVDEADQSIQAGTFLWSASYRAELLAADAERLLARHTGYRRSGITHWRGLLLRGDALLVWDLLEGGGEHQFDLHWHLGLIPVALGDGRFGLEKHHMRLQGGEVSAHAGELTPPLGWVAPTYGKRRPTTTVRVRHRGRAPHEFVTFLGPNNADVSLESWAAELRELKACLPLV